MNERDDSLRDLLRQWETPPPSAFLDERVRRSYRNSLRSPWKRYAPMAAAAALLLAVGTWWSRPVPTLEMNSGVIASTAGTSYVTTLNLTGFEPIRNGKITTTTKGDPQ